MSKIKNILIVGATGTIGRSITHSLADEDVHLILHGTCVDKLTVLKNELSSLCDKVTSYSADLSNKSSTQSLVSDITDSHDAFDWIIHASGYIDDQESKRIPSYSHLKRTFLINTIAPIYITQSLQNRLKEGGGVLIISSTASLWGNPEFPIYAATKGALNTFTKALSKQFSKTNRIAIAICPGGTNTPMRERLAHDAAEQQSPDVIAKCINKITNHASEFTNGDIVVIQNGEAAKF